MHSPPKFIKGCKNSGGKGMPFTVVASNFLWRPLLCHCICMTMVHMKSLSGDYIINELDDNIVGSCVQVLTTDQRFMESCL